MKEQKKSALLAASVAGILSIAGVAMTSSDAHAGKAGMEKCYGINSCSGTGACGSKKYGHSCHGQNSCEGKAWLYIPEGTCTKIKGGRLTEE